MVISHSFFGKAACLRLRPGPAGEARGGEGRSEIDGGGAGAGSEATEPRPCPFRFGERGAGAPVVPPVAAATTGKARPWAAHSLVRGRRGREPPRLSRTTRTRSEERRVGKECVSQCRSRW